MKKKKKVWTTIIILGIIGIFSIVFFTNKDVYNENEDFCVLTCQEVYEDNYETIFLDEESKWDKFCEYEGADDEGRWMYERDKCYTWHLKQEYDCGTYLIRGEKPPLFSKWDILNGEVFYFEENEYNHEPNKWVTAGFDAVKLDKSICKEV